MGLKTPTEIVAALICNAGVGSSVGGEGVLNLGRAFQHAGARSVLVSLWNVEDESTNILGSEFFNEVERGSTKDVALLKARKNLALGGMAIRRSAFVLVGERDVLPR